MGGGERNAESSFRQISSSIGDYKKYLRKGVKLDDPDFPFSRVTISCRSSSAPPVQVIYTSAIVTR